MAWKAAKSVRVCHGGSLTGVNACTNGCMSVDDRSCFSYQVAAGSTMPENSVVEVIRKSSDSRINDYAVRIIKGKDNCSSGSRTSVFYQRNRIRQFSPFWVDVILPGASRPVSGAAGNIVTDPFPEEIEDFGLCTIDGIS
jgi:hypothetical protein